MLFKDVVKEAVRSIASVRLRSALALTGIAVGIGTVITIVSVGQIVKNISLEQFKDLGTDIIDINFYPEADFDEKLVKVDDLIALSVEVPEISESAPWSTQFDELRYYSETLEDMRGMSVGVTGESFASLNKLKVAEGRFISRLDNQRLYCVVGYKVAQAMRGLGARKILGERLRLNEHLFEIVGVLEEKPTTSMFSHFEANDSVFIPLSTLNLLSQSAQIPALTARVAPNVAMERASEAASSFLQFRIPGLPVSVKSPLELIDQMQGQAKLFTLLLTAIGSISLIIGGVGIMNVMIMSVTERRAEVGLRRALGARRRDIRRQFVTEAVVLCLVGGTVGIVVGIAASYVVCLISEWQFALSTQAMVIGVAVSTGVGILFGFLPAQQAARLDPIAALRI